MKSFYLKPKIIDSMKGYNSSQFVKDIVAGIIVAIIALPLSIALALASDAQPQQGIYTAVAAGFFVSLLGGSRVQIAGPTAAFAVIVAGIINKQGWEGLFIATVMAGIILIVMGILKVGALIKYVPRPITVGFTGGIAVTIFIGQIKDFLGISYPSGTKAIEAVEKIEANIEYIDTFDWQSLLIGVICLAVLIFYPKLDKKVPPSLIAVVLGAGLVALIPLFKDNVSTIGSLYNIPSGLPKVDFAGITINTDKIIELLPDAVTIAVLAGIESLLSCVVADGMVKDKHNPNAELVGQGVANIASVFFGGIPATGAIARTAANVKNGGRTPIAGIVHAVVLLMVLLFLMPYAELIPMPAIAAILFIVAYNMSEWRHFVSIIKSRRMDEILLLLVTFALTVVFDLVVAIAVGLSLYIIIVLYKKCFKEKGEAVEGKN